MLAKVSSGHSSGNPERLKCQPRFSLTPTQLILGILIAALSMWAGSLYAQPAESAISAYADAIKQSTISDRIVAMERYLTLSGGSRLKVDALEFLVWDHMRLNHQSQSVRRARELLAVSPANPIAVAVLNQDVSAAPRDKIS